MKNTLIVLAHPNFETRSIANKMIVEAVKTIPGVRLKDLYRECPSFHFQVEAEQKALLAADSIIFQFPFYWYSMPGILKEWMDQVLTYGFAYGSTGDKLKGKAFVASVTIGGPEDSYRPDGYNHFPVADLLKPLEQMTNLTGMVHHPPIVSHGMIYIPGVYNTKEEVEQRARDHARRLTEYIQK